MADESEKRFLAVMDKLFHTPPRFKSTMDPGDQLSRGNKRINPWSDFTVGDQNLRRNGVYSMQNKSEHPPQCRPWDRADLFRRLATFKSMTWFAKPQAMSAINCARRGWINVNEDTIECEACGARLLFSTPQAWTQEQIEKTALVYSLKLDSGHKLLCPWVDNICDEGLAQFPPKQSVVLVDDYKKRYNVLSQLLALPAISSSAIDCMRSPQLDQFLKGLPISENLASNQTSTSDHLGCEPDIVSVSYNQAQKIISLCGWEPHPLSYTVGCKEAKRQSVSNASSNQICDTASSGPNNTVNVFPSSIGDCMEEPSDNAASEIDFDPNSVVFDCQLCGARVGLWTFSSIPRPMEFLRLVGYTDITGGTDGGHYNNSKTEKLTDYASTGTKVLDEGPSKLNLTIAGGPPPTKQNYRAIISLPIVGRNLRARFSNDPNFNDQLHATNSSKVCKDQSIVVVSENEASGRTSESTEQNDILENQSTSSNAVVQGSIDANGSTETENVNSIATGDQEQFDSYSVIGGISACVDGNKSNNDTHAEAENPTQVGPKVLPVSNSVSSAIEEGLPVAPLSKKMEFDPIRQHRHFCPWITSTGTSKPGWQQTLSALQRNNEFSSPSAENISSSLIEVDDDPIESIRKLFTSPPSKRTKLSHQSKA